MYLHGYVQEMEDVFLCSNNIQVTIGMFWGKKRKQKMLEATVNKSKAMHLLLWQWGDWVCNLPPTSSSYQLPVPAAILFFLLFSFSSFLLSWRNSAGMQREHPVFSLPLSQLFTCTARSSVTSGSLPTWAGLNLLAWFWLLPLWPWMMFLFFPVKLLLEVYQF